MVRFFAFYRDKEQTIPIPIVHPEFFRASPSFLEQLCIQLTAELERLTGVKGIGRGAYFFPYMHEFMQEKRANSGERIYKDGHDYMRLIFRWYVVKMEFWTEWISKKEPGRRIDTCEEVGPDDIEFTIPDIPWPDSELYKDEYPDGVPNLKFLSEDHAGFTFMQIHKICLQTYPDFKKLKNAQAARATREAKSKGRDKAIKTSKRKWHFEVEMRVPEWPDADIVVVTGETSDETISAVDECLNSICASWNEAQEHKKNNQQLVHYVSAAGELTEEGLVYNVDFGSCETPKVLYAIFNALDNLKDIPIKRVIVR